jgi:hypothetical protein
MVRDAQELVSPGANIIWELWTAAATLVARRKLYTILKTDSFWY